MPYSVRSLSVRHSSPEVAQAHAANIVGLKSVPTKGGIFMKKFKKNVGVRASYLDFKTFEVFGRTSRTNKYF